MYLTRTECFFLIHQQFRVEATRAHSRRQRTRRLLAERSAALRAGRNLFFIDAELAQDRTQRGRFRAAYYELLDAWVEARHAWTTAQEPFPKERVRATLQSFQDIIALQWPEYQHIADATRRMELLLHEPAPEQNN